MKLMEIAVISFQGVRGTELVTTDNWKYLYGHYGCPDSLVKNPPAMQETLVWFLGQEDPLEKG